MLDAPTKPRTYDTQDISSQLSSTGKYITNSIKSYHQNILGSEETLEISQVFGFVARIYEKIRSSVENKSEQVLRRFAIERALTRPDLGNKPAAQQTERLIKELTWSRFLDNRVVTRVRYDQVVTIIQKYETLNGFIKEYHSNHAPTLRKWLIPIASAEIEEILSPSYTRLHLVTAFYHWLWSRYQWITTPAIDEHELKTQIYIAVHRSLAKSDLPIIQYYLLLLLFPQWGNADEQVLRTVAAHIPSLMVHMTNLTNHPHKNPIYRYVQQNTAPFIFLESIIETYEQPDQLIKNPTALAQLIREVAREKYAVVRKQIRRGIMQSIIYIFCTKVIMAVLIEYPYDRYIAQDHNWIPLVINIVLPPILMFLVGMTVSPPGPDNTDRLVDKIMNIMYKSTNSSKLPIKLNLSPSTQRWSKIFLVIYSYVFVMTCMFVGYILMSLLRFSFVSTGLFFTFVSLVLLFGFRIRWHAQELLIAKPDQGVLPSLLSMLSMPFLNLGVWLSSSLSKINVITFILDKIIDAPLKSSVNSAEEWTRFIRDQREEAVEVPRD